MRRAVEMVLVLGALLLGGPGEATAAEEPQEVARAIWIRPTVNAAEAARRDAEESMRWERLRREVESWRRHWDPAVRPVRRAVGEALGSLRITWGPYSRNLGWAVIEEVSRLRRQAVLPAPDRDLDARLRRSLAELEQGGEFCLRGMPTRAQLRLEQGLRRMDQALAAFQRGIPRPGGPRRIRLLAAP